MTKKFNEKGITLVELLAALALFGVISALIWNLFFQALNFNDRAVTQNQLQQEANLILNTIQQFHTKYTITNINSVNNESESFLLINASDIATNPITPKTEKFANNQILYEVEITPNQFNNALTSPVLVFEITLTLTSKNNDQVFFKTKTTFSKLIEQK